MSTHTTPDPAERPAVPPAPEQPPRPDAFPSPQGWPPPPAAGVPPRDRPAGPGPWGLAVPWGFWESVLVGVCGFIIGAILALPVAAGSTNGDLTNLQFAIAGVLGEVGIFVSVMGWLSIRHRRAIPALALNLRKPVDAAIGFGLGIVIYFVAVLGIAQVIGWLLDRIAGHSIQSPDQLPTSLTGFPLVLTGFLVIVCAPVAEELLFRGMLFRSLRDRHGFWPGAIVSSVLFGLVHWQGSPWESSVLLVSTLMFVGLGLASLYEWRRNILTNMAAHAGFNVVGFFLFANGNGLVPFRHWL